MQLQLPGRRPATDVVFRVQHPNTRRLKLTNVRRPRLSNSWVSGSSTEKVMALFIKATIVCVDSARHDVLQYGAHGTQSLLDPPPPPRPPQAIC
jgi:hypothetical protein